jgi:hypothetical protein
VLGSWLFHYEWADVARDVRIIAVSTSGDAALAFDSQGAAALPPFDSMGHGYAFDSAGAAAVTLNTEGKPMMAFDSDSV